MTVRRRWLGLFLCALPACVVDSPLAQRTQTAEGMLMSEVDDWCTRACTRFAECEGSSACDCDADGDSAGPAPEQTDPPDDYCQCSPDDYLEECLEGCDDVMSGFSGLGEACAEAGLDSMECIDDAGSCSELRGETENCFREPKEISACNGGKVACRNQDGGSPAGPVPLPDGTAGTASAAGGSSGASAGVLIERCEYSFSDCSDGADYHIDCTGPTDAIECNCFRSGDYGGTFVLPGSCYLPSNSINSGCGWQLLID